MNARLPVAVAALVLSACLGLEPLESGSHAGLEDGTEAEVHGITPDSHEGRGLLALVNQPSDALLASLAETPGVAASAVDAIASRRGVRGARAEANRPFGSLEELASTLTSREGFDSLLRHARATGWVDGQLVFMPGEPIAPEAIDGVLGPEWDDAGTLRSGRPALGTLPDWSHEQMITSTTMPERADVLIRTKRDQENLYIAVYVEDRSRRHFDGWPLMLGEYLGLFFDSDKSRGTHPGDGPTALSRDTVIEVRHAWAPDSSDVRLSVKRPEEGDGESCGTDWEAVPYPTRPQLAVGKPPGAAGYTIEMKIPLGLLGGPSTDVGLSITVGNDVGFCEWQLETRYCNATAVAFPSWLTLYSDDGGDFLYQNFKRGAQCMDWEFPEHWGTGLF